MALIRCPECGQTVSDKAHACPQCGYPITTADCSPKTATPVNQVAEPIPAQPEAPEPTGSSEDFPEVPKLFSKEMIRSWILLILLGLMSGALLWALLKFSPQSKDADKDVKTVAVTMTDGDGNEYQTVKIGEQVWCAENLHSLKDNSGNEIPVGCQSAIDKPYVFCVENENMKKYGYLYNWEAARTLCPDGWHLPTKAEFEQLVDFLSQSDMTCGDNPKNVSKALASTWGWCPNPKECVVGNDQEGNNSTNFNALPAGFYDKGLRLSLGSAAYFWSDTEGEKQKNAFLFYITDKTSSPTLKESAKSVGRSVRCVKD